MKSIVEKILATKVRSGAEIGVDVLKDTKNSHLIF
jgi:hypothetical protein